MSNVLTEEKKHKVLSLDGSAGRTAHRAADAPGVRWEMAGAYLKGARNCSTTAGRLETPNAGKTGQSSDHRPTGNCLQKL
jgi:hypothetical protein